MSDAALAKEPIENQAPRPLSGSQKPSAGSLVLGIALLVFIAFTCDTGADLLIALIER